MSAELDLCSIGDCALESKYKVALRKVNVNNVADLMTQASEVLSKSMKIPLSEVLTIKKAVCTELSSRILLDDLPEAPSEQFTTGDGEIDEAVGGGIRTGLVWEIAGEGGSGKSQMSYQLALSVQLPLDLGGLGGSACFLFTRQLQTKRIIEIAQNHSLLSKADCTLSDIHTMMVRTPEVLLHVLSIGLPSLLKKLSTENRKPVRLVILDSISSLLYADGEAVSTLNERSKQLIDISRLMHTLASSHNIAFVVINGVQDSFFHEREAQDLPPGVLYYKEQERWFGSSHLDGKYKKVARLGLIWANQPNVRLMLSKTNRRKLMEPEHPPKRRRLNESLADGRSVEHQEAEESVVVRQLSVVFSSFSHRKSCEFFISIAGVKSLSQAVEPSLPGAGNLDGNSPHTVDPKSPMRDSSVSLFVEDEDTVIVDGEDHLWASFVELSQQDLEELESSLASGSR